MAVPNVYLAGAPKSGTSSLFNWLREHPAVCGSTPKESFYLMDAANPMINAACNYHLCGVDGYSRFFEPSADATVWLDGSCQYIYQETARTFVRSLEKPSTVVFLLRNPADRVRSAFWYFAGRAPLAGDVGDLLSVTDRLMSGAAEDAAQQFSTSSRYDYLVRNMIAHSEYVTYLRRWRESLAGSRAQMLVYAFEELASAPDRFIQALCGALGIDPSWYAGYRFNEHNVTYIPKSQRLDVALRYVAKRSGSRGVQEAVQRFNRRWNGRRPQLSSRDGEALKKLDRHFVAFNAVLADEFGVDVGRWWSARR